MTRMFCSGKEYLSIFNFKKPSNQSKSSFGIKRENETAKDFCDSIVNVDHDLLKRMVSKLQSLKRKNFF